MLKLNIIYMQSISCKIRGSVNHKLESRLAIIIARRNINNLRYADDTTLMAESEEELKSLLIKVKEENVKARLKSGIQRLRAREEEDDRG